MEKEFITYEQALSLKDLGFDYEIEFYKDNLENIFDMRTPNDAPCILWQQAFRWLRNQYATCWYIQSEYPAFYGLYIHNGTDYDHTIYDTYEEAEQACLDKLIEIVKNK